MTVSMNILTLDFDEMEKFLQRKAVMGSFYQKLFNHGFQHFKLLIALGGLTVSNETPLPWVCFQNAFIRQFADGFLDSIRIHPQFAADDPHGGHLLTGNQLAGGNRLLHRSDDLFVDRLTGLEGKEKWQHLTVLNVVVQLIQIKGKTFH